MKEDFKIGVNVSFKDNSDNVKWFLKSHIGQIIATRGFGPQELMITVDFKGQRVHVPHTSLCLIENH